MKYLFDALLAKWHARSLPRELRSLQFWNHVKLYGHDAVKMQEMINSLPLNEAYALRALLSGENEPDIPNQIFRQLKWP